MAVSVIIFSINHQLGSKQYINYYIKVSTSPFLLIFILFDTFKTFSLKLFCVSISKVIYVCLTYVFLCSTAPVLGNHVCSMVCRIRRYRGLSSGFGVKDRMVTFMPFMLKFYFKNINDEEGHVIYLVIQATPFFSAFKCKYLRVYLIMIVN